MTEPATHHEPSNESLEGLLEWLDDVDMTTHVEDTTTPNHPEPLPNNPPPPSTSQEETLSSLMEVIEESSPVLPAKPLETETIESKPPKSSSKPSRRGRLQDVLSRLEAGDRFGTKTIRRSTPSKEPVTPSPPVKADNNVPPVVNESVPKTATVNPIPASLSPEQKLEIELLTTKLEILSTELNRSQSKIAKLEAQVYEPTELINPLLPLITELLQGKITEVGVTREEIFNLVMPIIDRVIRERSLQDKTAMSQAFSSLLPEAISHHIQQSPDEIANAIGPTMGRAIKEQIRLERDSMVDALYPVIGNTIAKYMGEVIHTINDKVEKTLSMKGFQRKIRSKIQGVSEAELIMQESLPFQVSAVFLIHKNSGLIIAEAQQTGEERLESDMVAGMLTAIRSFANDCFSNAKNAELSEIEYDCFKIILEVAGYCYLAVVNRGDVPKLFVERIRTTLSKIVEQYDRAIQHFDGDSEKVPKPIPAFLEALMIEAKKEEYQHGSSRIFITLFGLALLSTIIFVVYTMITTYQEEQVLTAFDNTPELAVYRLAAESQLTKITLKGKLPNEQLRGQAEMIALNTFPGLEFDNQMVAVDIPPDPVLARQEVQRIADIFNQQENMALTANYTNRKVFVTGHTEKTNSAQSISKAFQAVPGIQTVVVAMEQEQADEQLKAALTQRIYFDSGSDLFDIADLDKKVAILQKFLQKNPAIHLKIIGHSDSIGSIETNQKLAQDRALTVKQALQMLGVAENRLFVEGIGKPPPDLENSQNHALSRCVRFEKMNLDELTTQSLGLDENQ